MYLYIRKENVMISYALPTEVPRRKKTGFTAVDLALVSTRMNASLITLIDRYPKEGSAINEQSEMLVLVLEGSVSFNSEDEEVLLPQGATIIVEAGRKYFWVPKPDVRLYVVSTPPWNAGQHRQVKS